MSIDMGSSIVHWLLDIANNIVFYWWWFWSLLPLGLWGRWGCDGEGWHCKCNIISAVWSILTNSWARLPTSPLRPFPHQEANGQKVGSWRHFYTILLHLLVWLASKSPSIISLMWLMALEQEAHHFNCISFFSWVGSKWRIICCCSTIFVWLVPEIIIIALLLKVWKMPGKKKDGDEFSAFFGWRSKVDLATTTITITITTTITEPVPITITITIIITIAITSPS